MAALMLLAAAAHCSGGPASPQAEAAGPPPARQKVALTMHVAGTEARSGVELVIRPGNPTCRFKEVVYPVKQDGWILDIPPIEVETVNANRDCDFSILFKEPGQPDRIIRRSVQINPDALAANPDKPQPLQVYLNSRTKLTSAPPPPAVKPSTPPSGPARPVATNPANTTTRKR